MTTLRRRRMRIVPSSEFVQQRLLLLTNKRWLFALLTLVVTSQWIVVLRFLPNHNNNNNNNNDNDKNSPSLLLLPPNMGGGGGQSKQQQQQQIPRNRNQGIPPPRRNDKKNNKHSFETTIQEATQMTWNGLPLTLVSSTTLPTSMIHCVGDNFLPNAWLYRSCQYRNLCFSSNDDDDTTTQTAAAAAAAAAASSSSRSDGTFQLFVSDTQQQLQSQWNSWNHKYYARFSTNVHEEAITVSAIGTNPRWARKQQFQWHPRIVMIPPPPPLTMKDEPILPRNDAADDDDHQDHYYYYRLPSNRVWIPIFVKPTTNAMSLLMDNLLPLFNLMAMFGWDDDNDNNNDNNNNTKSLLVTILNGQPSSPIQATTTTTTTNGTKHDNGGDDDEEKCGQDCLQTMAQALSWMGAKMVTTNLVASPIPPPRQRHSQQQLQSFPTNQGVTISHDKNTRRRRMICASQGAAGIGMLTDHGLSRHGLSAKDYSTIRNTGRGPLLYKFRNYILKHVLPQPQQHQQQQQQQPQDQSTDRRQKASSPPFTITVALNDEPGTVTSTLMAQALQSGFQKQDDNQQHHSLVTIQTLPLAPLEQHLDATVIQKQAIQSQVWVTRAGDGSWPAFFLPRDATLVLLYDEMETVKDGKKQQQRKPAMHHFDLWNHASHLKVHWFSIQSILLPKRHNDDKDSTATDTDQYDGSSGMKLLLDLLLDEIQGLLVVSPEQKDRVATVGAADTLAAAAAAATLTQDANTGSTTMSSSSSSIFTTSRAHCIGENWEWDAGAYRSCHIQHLCIDVSQRPSPFVVWTSPFQDTLNATLQRRIATRPSSYYPTIATNLDTSVMVGQSIRLGTGEPWFPQPRRPPKSSGVVHQDGQDRSFFYYYELPDDIVWLPYYAEQPNANNPGHSLWDYFFPFYELVTMFGFRPSKEAVVDQSRQVVCQLCTVSLLECHYEILAPVGCQPPNLFQCVQSPTSRPPLAAAKNNNNNAPIESCLCTTRSGRHGYVDGSWV
jgi:hypothetical protein